MSGVSVLSRDLVPVGATWVMAGRSTGRSRTQLEDVGANDPLKIRSNDSKWLEDRRSNGDSIIMYTMWSGEDPTIRQRSESLLQSLQGDSTVRVGRAGGGRWSGGSSAGRSALAGAGWSGGNWACRQGAGRVGAGGFRQASPIASGTGGRGPGRWCRAEIGAHVERAAVKWLAGACQSRVGGGRVDSRGVPKDVGAGGVREGVGRAAGGRDPDGTGGVGRTGTGLAGPGRIGLQMAPGVGGRRAAVGWLGGCRAEVGMDGCRAAG